MGRGGPADDEFALDDEGDEDEIDDEGFDAGLAGERPGDGEFDLDEDAEDGPGDSSGDVDSDEAEDDELFDGEVDADTTVSCPYCGETTQISLDYGSGAVQEYVEDCEVCCRPWRVRVRYDRSGAAEVTVEPT